MTYEKFLARVPNYVGIKDHEIIVLKGRVYPEPPTRYRPYYKKKEREKINKQEYEPALYFSCYVGGVKGGSCWDDGSQDNHHYSSSNETLKYDELDSILQDICPNITFLAYKRIESLMSDIDTWTEGEYYGNTSEYQYQTLSLKKLYDFLLEMKVI